MKNIEDGYTLFNRRIINYNGEDKFLNIDQPRPKGFYFVDGSDFGHYVMKTFKNKAEIIMKETYIKRN